MNKKAKQKIFKALSDEFTMSIKEQCNAKKTILRLSKQKMPAGEIWMHLRKSKMIGRGWGAMMQDEKVKKELLEAEQRGLLCGNKNA